MLSTADGYAIVVAAIAAYGLVLYALYRRGLIGPDRSLSLLGPALMTKTRRGLSLLDRLGRFRRAWSGLADFGVLLAAVAMAVVIGVLLLDSVIALRIPASAAPSPSEALGIPGINPIIPLGYGVAALVVGIVLHELMHGVIARSQGIRVKSVGILWFVVPVGAFVEPDETEMTEARRRPRSRVAAAGILANFGLATIFFLLLGAAVGGSIAPNATGVGVAYVLPGFPAGNASLAAGDIITSVNDTPVPTATALYDAIANTTPNETIPLSFYSVGAQRIVTESITLTSKSSYTHDPADAHTGFLGFSPSVLTPGELQGILADPWTSSAGPVDGVILWIVLPLESLEPVQGTTASYFHVVGPLAPLGSSGFWVLANLLFWLAWMDLLLGLSNALPLVPLDGGLLFRDFSGWIASKIKKGWDADRLDAFSGKAVTVSSIAVVFLLLWQFIAPHL